MASGLVITAVVCLCIAAGVGTFYKFISGEEVFADNERISRIMADIAHSLDSAKTFILDNPKVVFTVEAALLLVLYYFPFRIGLWAGVYALVIFYEYTFLLIILAALNIGAFFMYKSEKFIGTMIMTILFGALGGFIADHHYRFPLFGTGAQIVIRMCFIAQLYILVVYPLLAFLQILS